MVIPVVFLGLCLLVVTVRRVRRAMRRRADAQLVVSTWPGIELSEEYGGWNPDAYDAGTGHDHTLGWIGRTAGQRLR